jgi:uncharacterized tellurite resistance protein B-like protein
MGLFDMFKSDAGTEMTPHLAFATSLIYMIAADGKIENEEIGQLLAVLGGEKDASGTIGVGAQNEKLLRSAQRYVESHSVEDFLTEAPPLLTDTQRMCILTNLCDSLLSDGNADPTEQQMFYKFMQAFDVTEERFQPFFEVMMLKNDRSVFTNDSHPKNQPGYEVKLPI